MKSLVLAFVTAGALVLTGCGHGRSTRTVSSVAARHADAYAAVADVHPPSVQDPPAVDNEPKAHGDIRLTPGQDAIVFGNSRLELRFDRKDGSWDSLTTPGLKGSFIAPGEPAAAVDFRVDGVWQVETLGATFIKHGWAVDEKTGGASLQMVYGINKRGPVLFIPPRWSDRVPDPIPAYAPAAAYEFELTATYTLFPNQRRLERSATLTRNLGKDFFHSSFRRMDGFLFVLPNAVVADPAECTVEVPGPLFTYTYIDADTPYTKLAGTFIDCKTTPDRLPGIVGIENPTRNLTLSTWMDTKSEVAYQSFLSGDGRRISVLFHDMRCDRLADRGTVKSDAQRVEVTETFREAQAEHVRVINESMPLSATTPDWAREMVILEMMPGFHPGGFKGMAEHLPFYRDIGFNTLYLLPHWQGSYSNFDPMKVDPALGTAEDLKSLVKTAHDLGMRVLFDMVVHGFHPDSHLVKDHPEFYTRDEHGLIETHFNWGSTNTDPASEAYLRYMEDLVVHDLRVYDIDGYRIDAASYKPANWDPAIQLQRRPWQSSSTLPLYRRMYAAMQAIKPDVVFYSEMFGPAYHSVSNLAQDANWAVVTDVFGQFDRGEINAATYKAGMAQLQDSMQPGANRIRFCRNHDTSWFFPKHYKGFTGRFLALDAVHVLFGVPVVFAGDPDHPPSLADDPKAIAHYTKVIGLRKRFPEFARGEVLLREVECDNAWVFSGLRRSGDETSIALVSLSEKPQVATVRLGLAGATLAGAELTDPADGSTVTLKADGPATLTLEPFQVLVGRLRGGVSPSAQVP